MEKSRIFFIILILVLIILISVGYYNYQKPGEYDYFAKCLTEKGAVFYGSFQCPHCADQKRIFGKSIEFVNYVECGPLNEPPAEICLKEKIERYPTWKINNEKFEGVKEIQQLSAISGCSIK